MLIVRRTIRRNDGLRSESGTTLAPCAPESPNYHFALIERVVQVAGDFRNIQTPDAWDAGLRIGHAGAGQEREHLKGLFEFGNEDIAVDPVLDPPSLLAPDVLLGGCGESNPAGFQRERSSLRISSASTSRFCATSTSESRRAWCKAARSLSSSQSPGSSGRSSTSAPSGKSVGSSSTRRPARTRALIVMSRSVALEEPPNKALHPTGAGGIVSAGG